MDRRGTVLTAPGPSGGRIVALDALRGIAVAGIALMNVYIYALPPAAYFNPAAAGSESDTLKLSLRAKALRRVKESAAEFIRTYADCPSPDASRPAIPAT